MYGAPKSLTARWKPQQKEQQFHTKYGSRWML